jgi:hypothetical protein
MGRRQADDYGCAGCIGLVLGLMALSAVCGAIEGIVASLERIVASLGATIVALVPVLTITLLLAFAGFIVWLVFKYIYAQRHPLDEDDEPSLSVQSLPMLPTSLPQTPPAPRLEIDGGFEDLQLRFEANRRAIEAMQALGARELEAMEAEALDLQRKKPTKKKKSRPWS